MRLACWKWALLQPTAWAQLLPLQHHVIEANAVRRLLLSVFTNASTVCKELSKVKKSLGRGFLHSATGLPRPVLLLQVKYAGL
jgi:hypothetical protein